MILPSPYQSLQSLVKIYQHINALAPGYWRKVKLKETLELIHACSGLWLEATVPQAYALQDQTVPVTFRVVNRAPIGIMIHSVISKRTGYQLEFNIAARCELFAGSTNFSSRTSHFPALLAGRTDESRIL